jgi:hypothetical protein
MDWTDLAQNNDKWRALVNMVLNLWVPQSIVDNYSSADRLAISKKELAPLGSLS